MHVTDMRTFSILALIMFGPAFLAMAPMLLNVLIGRLGYYGDV